MDKRGGGRPTIGGARSESLRALVRAITATDHNGVQRRTAEALGVSAGALNDFVNGRSGAGQALMDGLVTYLRRPIGEVVAASGDLASLRAPRVETGASVEVVFGALPLWPQLLEGARALEPSVPEWCWRDVAEAHVWVRSPITSAMVADMARFVLRHTPPHA